MKIKITYPLKSRKNSEKVLVNSKNYSGKNIKNTEKIVITETSNQFETPKKTNTNDQREPIKSNQNPDEKTDIQISTKDQLITPNLKIKDADINNRPFVYSGFDIKPGLNILHKCNNINCTNFNKEVLTSKGFGEQNIALFAYNTACNYCSKDLQFIKIIFYQCIYIMIGKKENKSCKEGPINIREPFVFNLSKWGVCSFLTLPFSEENNNFELINQNYGSYIPIFLNAPTKSNHLIYRLRLFLIDLCYLRN